MRPKYVAESLEYLFRNEFPALLVGPPGVGKTELVKQATDRLKIPLVISHPVVKDPMDYKGLPAVHKGVADFLPFGDLRLMMKATRRTVVFMDDLGQAPASVQAAAMQLVLERSIDGKAISDKIIFAAATNRTKDGAGVRQFLNPLKGRYYSILPVQPNLDDWTEWANENRMPGELIAFVRFRTDMLFEENPSPEIVKPRNPRSLFHAGEILNGKPPKHLIEALMETAAGKAFSMEFVKYLQIFRNLPTPAQVFKNPNRVRVPSELSEQHAMVGSLANAVSKQTFESLLVYLKRLPIEFHIMCVRDAAVRNAEITQSKQFEQWLEENGNVIVG